jgi:hypothetical protein
MQSHIRRGRVEKKTNFAFNRLPDKHDSLFNHKTVSIHGLTGFTARHEINISKMTLLKT